ncbi:hypothetical protein CTI12_AA317040 [Artemisia annua]|uniref:Uncharacterized protein n=1 Tax=Artemisia annua TaxID=35608 RepID=A0A2U1N1Z7_ARTAN|nr:hypothetical protein CTI12_AA317040 [Artemisia annua]
MLSWWGFKFPGGGMDFTDVINGSFYQHISSHLYKVFQGVYLVTVWAVWMWRNKIVYSQAEDKLAVVSEDIFALIQIQRSFMDLQPVP